MAIRIEPSRTGATVELKDIASILSEQNQVLAVTAESQEKLSKSFASFIQMLEKQDADEKRDEAQAEARQRNQPSKASGYVQGMKEKMTGITGGVEGLVAGIVPFALGLLRRFLPALLTVGLADQIAKGLEDKLGPELANVVEYALTGAGIGFLLGGAKGGIYGAILMALFSDASREFVVGMVNQIFKTDFSATGPESFAVVGGAALATKFMIGLLPKLLPLLLSPTGFLAVAITAGLAGYFVYQNLTPEQQAAVDKITAPYRSLMSDISVTLLEKAAEASENIVDGIKEYLNSSLVSMGFGAKFLTSDKKAELLGSLSASDRSKYDDLEKEAIKIGKDFQTAFAGTMEEKDALRKRYGLEGTSQNELYEYFEKRSFELSKQMDAIVNAQKEREKAEAESFKNDQALIQEWTDLTSELATGLGEMPSPSDKQAYAEYEAMLADRKAAQNRLDRLTRVLQERKLGPFGSGTMMQTIQTPDGDFRQEGVSSGQYYSSINAAAADAIARANQAGPQTGTSVDASTNVIDNSVRSTTAALVEGGSATDAGDVYSDRILRMKN
jgi:hypothetical protein